MPDVLASGRHVFLFTLQKTKNKLQKNLNPQTSNLKEETVGNLR